MTLLDALPASAFVIDAVGTIRFASKSAASAVGLDPASMIGRSVLDFVDAQTAWVYASAVAMEAEYTMTRPIAASSSAAHASERSYSASGALRAKT